MYGIRESKRNLLEKLEVDAVLDLSNKLNFEI